MDPITTLSVVANVVALTETSIRVVKKLKEIREYGSLTANEDLKSWTTDVLNDKEILQAEISKQAQSRVHEPSFNAIRDAAQECLDLSDDLKTLLGTITAGLTQSTSIKSALRQTLRTFRNKGKVDSMEEKLDKCYTRLDSLILQDLWTQQKNPNTTFKHSLDSLNQKQQNIIQHIIDNKGHLCDHIDRVLKAAQDEIKEQIVGSQQQTADQLNRLYADEASSRNVVLLLGSLRFDSMCERQDYIQSRVGQYGSTYEWIFKSGDSSSRAAPFHDWLASDDNLFWISGKPGSGKSSLVNYIHQELQTPSAALELLEQQVAPAKLQVLAFLFYRPSHSALQKSLQGMWRSLCFQIVSSDRELGRQLLSDDNVPQALRQRFSQGLDVGSPWLTAHLEALFMHITMKSSKKFFLLLDGLDEAEEDHFRLLETVQELSSMLRICCSSRPIQPFQSNLLKYKSLKVQDLTFSDIHDVVSQRLQQRLQNPTALDFSRRIAERAEGVFLWACIVTDNVLRGHEEKERLHDLRMLVDDAPEEMTDLFKKMLQRANPAHNHRPKPYLQYVVIAKRLGVPLTLADLLFAQCDQYALDQCIISGSIEQLRLELTDRAVGFEANVTARCAGLVEVIHKPCEHGRRVSQLYGTGLTIPAEDFGAYYWDRTIPPFEDDKAENLVVTEFIERRFVQFIHRTAFDFLTDGKEGRAFLQTCSVSEDEAHLNLLRARVARTCFHLEHPLLGYEKGSPSRGMGAIAILERHADQRKLSYHHLTHAVQAALLRTTGQDPDSDLGDPADVCEALNIQWLPGGMPLGLAIWFGHALTEGLFHSLECSVTDLTQSDRQKVAQLYWLLKLERNVRRLATEDEIFGEFPWTCSNETPKFAGAGDVSASTEADFWYLRSHTTRPPTMRFNVPYWKMIVVQLLRTRLHWDKGINNNEYIRWEADMAQTGFRLIRSADISLEATVDIMVFDPHRGQPNFLPFTGGTVRLDGVTSVLVRCTLQDVVRLALHVEDAAEFGVSRGKPTIRPLRWWHASDNWVDLKPSNEHQVFEVRIGDPERQYAPYEMRYASECLVYPVDNQIQALSQAELHHISGRHRLGKEPEGAFRAFEMDPFDDRAPNFALV